MAKGLQTAPGIGYKQTASAQIGKKRLTSRVNAVYFQSGLCCEDCVFILRFASGESMALIKKHPRGAENGRN